MCYGLSGSSSLKSKADALKYAIEFTTQWKEGEKIINFTAAEELYNFICKHVELPETFDDGLSSFFQRVNETIEEEKRNREKLEELKNSLNEEAIPLPGSSPLSHVANKLRSILRDNKFKSISGAGANDYSKETFRLHGNGEFLDVTITFSTCPKTE